MTFSQVKAVVLNYDLCFTMKIETLRLNKKEEQLIATYGIIE
ncbi:hypothetical protein JCM19302_2191 [Jejuia pallidilutea]|uniref:Uncharacterized protein n=1 Tax=Jejuia pallidilutea TaxID=504487 RepID=A0A090W9C9_9FLAO|nr:hypothetical protein JCM19302_2191 [Jejuia pallidilutea]GAL88420.1 hypothetical protein JCM19538_2933 [Jejuia pallidilutea]